MENKLSPFLRDNYGENPYSARSFVDRLPKGVWIVISFIIIRILFRFVVYTLRLPDSLNNVFTYVLLLVPFFYPRIIFFPLILFNFVSSVLFILFLSRGPISHALTSVTVSAVVISIYSEVLHRVSRWLFKMNEKLLKAKEEAERAKELAEEATRIKGQFLANMSHEIRTPLSGIMGITDLMIEEAPDNQHVQYLNMIKSSSTSLMYIINDILDFSKIEAGKIGIIKSQFDLQDSVTTVFERFKLQAQEKGLQLHCEMKKGLPQMIESDRCRVEQILNNLLSNSIKYTDNGSITLVVSPYSNNEDSQEILFSVRDTGIGIPREKADLVFQVFSQVDSSYTKKYAGTGLGLAITKQLVELLGGQIWFESSEGVGSTFFFTIPTVHIKSNPNLEKDNEIVVAGDEKSNQLKILLAEDNKVNQTYLFHFLQKKGFLVSLASNGKEALDKYNAEAFDVILMDIQMPVMSGIDAVKEIRRIEYGEDRPRIPIVALSAFAMKQDHENFLKSGVDYFLPKPVDIPELLRFISGLELNKPAVDSTEKKPGSATTIIEETEPVRLEHIQELCDNEEGVIRDIYSTFLSDTPEKLHDLKSALKEKDLQAARSAVHSITNNCKGIAADKAAEISYDFETSIVMNRQDQLDKFFSDLETELDKVQQFLTVYLSS